eukprot:TRINITY_DN7572_c4_g1_i1.p2 TRINITY_DN7572_c4_g1~~TRINITY_DN7572_c4_g1_i1.p2  ORF type:complete len:973 (+),score=288.92 TRINITY_DN7572_c4_g1_i1:95-3013(+)
MFHTILRAAVVTVGILSAPAVRLIEEDASALAADKRAKLHAAVRTWRLHDRDVGDNKVLDDILKTLGNLSEANYSNSTGDAPAGSKLEYAIRSFEHIESDVQQHLSEANVASADGNGSASKRKATAGATTATTEAAAVETSTSTSQPASSSTAAPAASTTTAGGTATTLAVSTTPEASSTAATSSSSTSSSSLQSSTTPGSTTTESATSSAAPSTTAATTSSSAFSTTTTTTTTSSEAASSTTGATTSSAATSSTSEGGDTTAVGKTTTTLPRANLKELVSVVLQDEKLFGPKSKANATVEDMMKKLQAVKQNFSVTPYSEEEERELKKFLVTAKALEQANAAHKKDVDDRISQLSERRLAREQWILQEDERIKKEKEEAEHKRKAEFAREVRRYNEELKEHREVLADEARQAEERMAAEAYELKAAVQSKQKDAAELQTKQKFVKDIESAKTAPKVLAESQALLRVAIIPPAVTKPEAPSDASKNQTVGKGGQPVLDDVIKKYQASRSDQLKAPLNATSFEVLDNLISAELGNISMQPEWPKNVSVNEPGYTVLHDDAYKGDMHIDLAGLAGFSDNQDIYIGGETNRILRVEPDGGAFLAEPLKKMHERGRVVHIRKPEGCPAPTRFIKNGHPDGVCWEGTEIPKNGTCTTRCKDGYSPSHATLRCTGRGFVFVPEVFTCTRQGEAPDIDEEGSVRLCSDEGEVCRCVGRVIFGQKYLNDDDKGQLLTFEEMKAESVASMTVDLEVACSAQMVADPELKSLTGKVLETMRMDPRPGKEKRCWCHDKPDQSVLVKDVKKDDNKISVVHTRIFSAGDKVQVCDKEVGVVEAVEDGELTLAGKVPADCRVGGKVWILKPNTTTTTPQPQPQAPPPTSYTTPAGGGGSGGGGGGGGVGSVGGGQGGGGPGLDRPQMPSAPSAPSAPSVPSVPSMPRLPGEPISGMDSNVLLALGVLVLLFLIICCKGAGLLWNLR